MKTRLLLYTLAGVALVLAFIMWPAETTPYNNTSLDRDPELTAILESSERGEVLRTLLNQTPDAEKRDMAFLLKNMPDFIVSSDEDGGTGLDKKIAQVFP